MNDEPPRLPESPTVRRRLIVPRWHAIGQVTIVLLVVLALLGAVGEAQGTAHEESERVTVTVVHPSLIRYKMLGRLEVIIEARGRAIDDAVVAIDAPYLDGFSGVTFQPEPALETRELMLIPVGTIAAETDRVVSAEVQAERYWLHEGWVEVRAGDEPLARLSLATFVFP